MLHSSNQWFPALQRARAWEWPVGGSLCKELEEAVLKAVVEEVVVSEVVSEVDLEVALVVASEVLTVVVDLLEEMPIKGGERILA
jgi:hypothetical protein